MEMFVLFCFDSHWDHSLQEALFIGATESPPSNYYIGDSTCMTSMYRVHWDSMCVNMMATILYMRGHDTFLVS